MLWFRYLNQNYTVSKLMELLRMFIIPTWKLAFKKDLLFVPPSRHLLRWTQCKSGIEWLGPGRSRQLLRDGQYGRQCINNKQTPRPIHILYSSLRVRLLSCRHSDNQYFTWADTKKKITELLKSDRLLIRPHKIRLFKYFFLSFEKAMRIYYVE